MMWRNVTLDSVKGLQSAFLTAAVLLGAVLVVTTPPLTNQAAATTRWWGVALIVFALLGSAGELWIGHGRSSRRWLPAWLAHVGLMAVMVGLAFDSLVNIGTPGSTGLELLHAIAFAQLAWVYRLFIHWRADVSQ